MWMWMYVSVLGLVSSSTTRLMRKSLPSSSTGTDNMLFPYRRRRLDSTALSLHHSSFRCRNTANPWNTTILCLRLDNIAGSSGRSTSKLRNVAGQMDSIRPRHSRSLWGSDTHSCQGNRYLWMDCSIQSYHIQWCR